MSEMSPQILKSTRHSKIAGNFGEALLLYWLSKHGFECATLDHTGIDLIAHNPHRNERMGISVKSRTRSSQTKEEAINIANDQFEKVERACKAFGCVPYFGLVADAPDIIRVFVLSMAHLREHFSCGARVFSWKMTEKALSQCDADPEIQVFTLQSKMHRWWTASVSGGASSAILPYSVLREHDHLGCQ